MHAKIVHCKHEAFDQYIGRPTIYGNPFVIGRDGTRKEVIKKYEEWVRKQPSLMHAIKKLKDLTLGCWCSPLPCHGDVILKIANEEQP